MGMNYVMDPQCKHVLIKKLPELNQCLADLYYLTFEAATTSKGLLW